MWFLNINEKRAAIRAATEQPRRTRLQSLRDAVVDVFYRIRRPNVRAGVSVHASVTDAVNVRDLDVWEGDWFGGQRAGREWMKGAAGSVVPGSYDDEVRR